LLSNKVWRPTGAVSPRISRISTQRPPGCRHILIDNSFLPRYPGRHASEELPSFTEANAMIFDVSTRRFVGPAGELIVPAGDELTPRLAMIAEGECDGLGAAGAAEKYGLTRQRYYQVLNQFKKHGALALQTQKRGPKTNYVRTDEVERQVIRHRFLDPDASVDIIAQKLRQAGFLISTRSVERVIEKYGLQKKTPSLPPRP
jgi:transposase